MVRTKKFNLPEDAAAYVAYLQAASARRVKTEKLCAQCGTTFTGITKALYCSPRCRVKAHYYASKERRRTAPPAAAPQESNDAD